VFARKKIFIHEKETTPLAEEMQPVLLVRSREISDIFFIHIQEGFLSVDRKQLTHF